MPENKNNTVELLKYPFLVFSILIALIVARYFLGLEFGAITELTSEGVKFAQSSEATFQALSAIEQQLNEALVRIDVLEQSSPRSHDAEMQLKIEKQSTAAAQEVSDKIANASAAKNEIKQALSPRTRLPIRGYIWIGNYNHRWDGLKLASLDTGQPAKLKPEQMQPGTEYRVLGNMVLRDGLPANTKEYYKGREIVGIIPRGQAIRLLKSPVGVDREYAVQYWAEVETASVATE